MYINILLLFKKHFFYSCISLFIYRSPEGLISRNDNRAVADEFKYIYTLGMLALELCSQRNLCTNRPKLSTVMAVTNGRLACIQLFSKC